MTAWRISPGGLQNASEAAKIGAGRIIDRCAATSDWCPTDADLLTIARDLEREDAVAAGTYDSMANAANVAPKLSKADLEREYGPPQPIVVTAAVKTRGKVAQDRHKLHVAGDSGQACTSDPTRITHRGRSAQ